MKFSTRVNIIADENTCTELPSFLKEYGINNPAILIDKNLFVSSDYIAIVIKNTKQISC